MVGKSNKITKTISTNSTNSTDSMDNSSMDVIEEQAIFYEQPIATIGKYDKNDGDIMTYDIEPELSNNIEYPRFYLGFHHFVHKNKTDHNNLTKKIEGKKVYLIVNKFEQTVDDYNESIETSCITYFNVQILDNNFYQVWELLIQFYTNYDNKNFISYHLMDGPGSGAQATICFRNSFSKDYIKNDKYFIVNPNDHDLMNHTNKINNTLLKSNNKLEVIVDSNKNKDKVDIITAVGGCEWPNNNILEEQDSFKFIFYQIVLAIKSQKKGGMFLCKMYETYTLISAKFILILKSFYETVYIIKPHTSQGFKAEKYIVCLNFKYDEKNKELKNGIEKLEKGLYDILKSKKHLNNIFPKYDLNNEYNVLLAYINSQLSNDLLLNITKIAKFINAQDYYGDAYGSYRDDQIKASKYWCSIYLPEKYSITKLKNNNKLLYDNLNTCLKKTDSDTKTLFDLLDL